MSAAPVSAALAAGHPKGLRALFLTEMWERFSYYGMRALLVLFMVDSVERGGMGLSAEVAAAIYGLYTAAVYLAALPGGWIADRFLGARRSIGYGGLVIAAGQFTLAFSRGNAFFLGLVLVVIGTGLLKPNVSAMVGELYPEGGARRDAGFTIFYMGINLGAAIGPLVSAALGEQMNWHYGFGAAGVGMVLGLIQYRLSAPSFGAAGLRPGRQGAVSVRDWTLLGLFVGGVVAVVGLVYGGVVRVNPLRLAQGTSYFIVLVATLYFLAAFFGLGLDAAEKKRVAVILVLFISSAVFWSGFEQAGSSLNLFAKYFTERHCFGHEIPAGWFQSLGPICIITLAPVVAWAWVVLARRGWEPSLPAKFGWGLLLLAAGFLVMAGAAKLAATGGQTLATLPAPAGGAAAPLLVTGHRVWPLWLILTYLLHSLGELCLSPVGLSSVTKLAPRRLVGQMMGIWFLATSLGNLFAGLMAGEMGASSGTVMAARYQQIVLMALGAGGLLLVLSKPVKALMAGVK
jgi:proton-dependent oligopeptide transporter, POT family